MTLLVATRPNLNLRVKEADGTPDVPGVSVIVVSNGTLTNDGGGQVTLNTGGGSTLPVVDTTAIVKGSVDNTKLVRFEVDGLTTATTRVLTVPDEDMTLAGRNVAQTFTQAQTITPASDGTATFLVEKSDGSDVFIVDSTNERVIIGDGSVGSGLYMVRATDGQSTRTLSYEGGATLGVYAPVAIVLYTGSGTQRLAAGAAGVVVDGLVISSVDTAVGNKIYFNTLANQVLQEQNRWGIVASYTGGDGSNANLALQSRGGINFFVDGGVGAGTASLKNNFWISANNGTYISTNTAETNTVDDVAIIRHLTSGTPAAGFGAALRFGLESSTTEDQNAARLVALWDVATHASRAADLVAYASDFGGEREIWRGRASGTAPMFAVLGATPIVRQAHIADADGTLADVTSKFNSLLAYLENFGFIATS